MIGIDGGRVMMRGNQIIMSEKGGRKGNFTLTTLDFF